MHVGSGHRPGHQGMVQVADRSALLSEVGDQLAAREQHRVDLLLVFVVGAHRCYEGSRPDHRVLDEITRCRGAGDHDVAFGDRLREVRNRCDFNGLPCQRGGEGARPCGIPVISANPRGLAYPQQGVQLRRRLRAAAADQERLASIAREVLRRDGGRGRRAQRSERHRIHHGQRHAFFGVAQHHHALDRRQAMARAVVREVGIGLRGKVGLPEREQRRLDVEAALAAVESEDTGRRRRCPAHAGGKRPRPPRCMRRA